jgi:hypothetical protein
MASCKMFCKRAQTGCVVRAGGDASSGAPRSAIGGMASFGQAGDNVAVPSDEGAMAGTPGDASARGDTGFALPESATESGGDAAPPIGTGTGLTFKDRARGAGADSYSDSAGAGEYFLCACVLPSQIACCSSLRHAWCLLVGPCSCVTLSVVLPHQHESRTRQLWRSHAGRQLSQHSLACIICRRQHGLRNGRRQA